MKKLVAILSLTAIATGAFAQGTVGFANTSTTLMRTNGTATGATAGNTAPSSSGLSYYYAVFTADSTVTSVDANGQNLLSPSWTFDGIHASNTLATAGGRLSGGTAATVEGWS